MQRILLIQLRELGDTLLATPLLRQAKRIHPNAAIDVVCEPRTEALFRHHPGVNDCFLLPRRASAFQFLRLAGTLARRRYQLVLDTQSLPKTAALGRLTLASRRHGFRRHWMRDRLLYTHPFGVRVPSHGNSFTLSATGRLMAEYTGLSKVKLLQDRRTDPTDLGLDFYISPADREQAAAFRSRYFDRPVAAVYACSRWKDRRWPSDKFAQLADQLSARGLQVFLVYGPGERPIAQAIAERMHHQPVIEYPNISFPVLKGVLDGCGLYVGVDGGPKHVATACGIPTVTLFGRIHPESWTDPIRSDQRFVATRPDTRPVPTRGRCTEASRIADISVDQVWRCLDDLIAPALAKAA